MRSILVAIVTTGCYTLTPYETVEKIPLVSNPPGAMVSMTDDKGTKAIGHAPLEAEVTVVHDRYEFHPVSSWLLTAGALGLTGLSLAYSIDPPDKTDELTGERRNNQTIQIFAITGAVLAGLASLIAVPASIVGQLNDGEDLGVHYKDGVPSFEGKLAGYTDATAKADPELTLPVPELDLQLSQNDAVIYGALVGNSVDAGSSRPVLAVFDLDPGNSGVASEIAVQLSDYLTAKIASGGRYRVVPKSALRERLGGEKKESYRDCFDETCQIELGKAVAAEKTLAAKLIRVGDTCALTATVFDLVSEAADAAQTIRTGCEQNGLMDAIDTVADRLSEK